MQILALYISNRHLIHVNMDKILVTENIVSIIVILFGPQKTTTKNCHFSIIITPMISSVFVDGTKFFATHQITITIAGQPVTTRKKYVNRIKIPSIKLSHKKTKRRWLRLKCILFSAFFFYFLHFLIFVTSLTSVKVWFLFLFVDVQLMSA